MSDDTTPPFGHGFACSEPFPLNATDRIAALQQQADELHAINRRLRDTLDAVRPVLRMVGPAAEGLVARINDVIGPDVLDRLWIEQVNSGHAAPVQGGE